MSRSIYISHGGGPLPILNDKSHKFMIDFMKELSRNIKEPEAIVVFSAHWESEKVSILSNRENTLLYDYYGFPQDTYNINYDLIGSPIIAKEIQNLLTKEGIDSSLELNRGFDHGVFIPLMLLYPICKIPVIQISLTTGLSPLEHINIGKALSKLDRDLLIIGSGFSFHNMGEFNLSMDIPDSKNDNFHNWLIDSITGDFSEKDRENRLLHWDNAPEAHYCHPREEHLIPLHCCYGFSGTKGKKIFDNYIAGKRAVGFSWDRP